MRTKVGAIVAVFFCTIITAAAQILYKFGVASLSWSFLAIITNYWLILGLSLYAIGAAILLLALRHGELSVLYPIIAMGYVWVNIASAYFFNEPLTPLKWAGIAIIILGMASIGYGSKVGVSA